MCITVGIAIVLQLLLYETTAVVCLRIEFRHAVRPSDGYLVAVDSVVAGVVRLRHGLSHVLLYVTEDLRHHIGPTTAQQEILERSDTLNEDLIFR